MKASDPADADWPCVALLIRHGATANNLAKPAILQGRGIDIGLSDEGREQAEKTGSFLSHHSFSSIYCSPLVRARETAESVAQHHDLDPRTVREITEVDVGRWEGRNWGEIMQTEPEEYRKFIDDPSIHGYPDGESITDVRDRVVPAIRRILESHAGQRIVIIGHNVVNRATLADAMNMPLRNARGLVQNNCGINVLRLKQGELEVRTMNATFHLE